MTFEESGNIVGVAALEQIKRFLSDDRTFFNTELISTIAGVVFSRNANTELGDKITDVVITFSTLADKYREIEKIYNRTSAMDHVDKALIDLAKELSIEYVNSQRKFTSYEINERFKNLLNESECRLALQTSGELRSKCEGYMKGIDVTSDYLESLAIYLIRRYNLWMLYLT